MLKRSLLFISLLGLLCGSMQASSEISLSTTQKEDVATLVKDTNDWLRKAKIGCGFVGFCAVAITLLPLLHKPCLTDQSLLNPYETTITDSTVLVMSKGLLNLMSQIVVQTSSITDTELCSKIFNLGLMVTASAGFLVAAPLYYAQANVKKITSLIDGETVQA